MTDRKLHHFYHIYADGEWRQPVQEHLQALKTSGLGEEEDFSLGVGLVGNDRNTAAVRKFLNDHSGRWSEIASSEQGWEQVTLNVLAQESQRLEGFVLYAHTKGASTPSSFNTAWRQRMTYYTVARWREALSSLETHHVYGCHWMQLEEFWLFAGNFWWTRMCHLRLLPAPQMHSRWAAEGWVGLLTRHIDGFAACDPAGPLPGKTGP